MSRTYRQLPSFHRRSGRNVATDVSLQYIVGHNMNLKDQISSRAGVSVAAVDRFFNVGSQDFNDPAISKAVADCIGNRYRHGLVPLYNSYDDAGVVYSSQESRRYTKLLRHRKVRHNGRRFLADEVRLYLDTQAEDIREIQEMEDHYAEIDAAYFDSLFGNDFEHDDYPEPEIYDDYPDPFYDDWEW